MPELPEVQTVVDELLAAGLVGQRVTCVHVFWPRTIGAPIPALFRRRIAGRVINHIRRRGKFIVFDLDQGLGLLVHLRMTGRLQLAPPGEARGLHQRLGLDLSDGRQLRFHDPRKFGRCYLLDETAAVLAQLGPEPLDAAFSVRRLGAMLKTRRRLLKPLLLDQRFIAGLGNIYVDEALWEAGIHPQRRSDTLTDPEIRALHRAIRKVLRQGLRNQGTTLGRGQTAFATPSARPGRNREALKVFRRTGEPCPRCRTPICRITVGQRSTHICPCCQPPAF